MNFKNIPKTEENYKYILTETDESYSIDFLKLEL